MDSNFDAKLYLEGARNQQGQELKPGEEHTIGNVMVLSAYQPDWMAKEGRNAEPIAAFRDKDVEEANHKREDDVLKQRDFSKGFDIIDAKGNKITFEPAEEYQHDRPMWHMIDPQDGTERDIEPIDKTYAGINEKRARRGLEPLVPGADGKMFFNYADTKANALIGIKPGPDKMVNVTSVMDRTDYRAEIKAEEIAAAKEVSAEKPSAAASRRTQAQSMYDAVTPDQQSNDMDFSS